MLYQSTYDIDPDQSGTTRTGLLRGHYIWLRRIARTDVGVLVHNNAQLKVLAGSNSRVRNRTSCSAPLNIAFYTTLSPIMILNSKAVAVTFANVLFGPFAWCIPVFVALSTFGAVNGILLTSSRLFYAGASYGQMPEVLVMIQINRMTPTPAILAMALLSMLYLTVSDIIALINYVGFATWLSIGASVLCLPWLRWKRPDLERPIKVHLIWPILYLLATIFVTAVPMIASPVETGIGLLMILTSIPVYLLFVMWKNKPTWFTKGSDSVTRTMQLLFLVVGKPKSAQL